MTRSFKRAAGAAIMVVAALAAVGCSSGTNGTSAPSSTGNTNGDGSLDRVKQAGKLVLCTDDAYAPMEFRDEKGNLVGFDIDLMAAVADKLGVTPEWKPTAWDGIIPALKAGQCDVIASGMNITPERQQEVNFTNPYVQMGQVLLVAKGNPQSIQKLDDLKGKTIAVQIGTTNAEAAHKIEGATVKEFDTFPLAMQDVINARADVSIADTAFAKYYLVQNPGQGEVVGAEIDPIPVGVAIKKQDKQLLDAVNQAFSDVAKDGTMDKIKTKWMGN